MKIYTDNAPCLRRKSKRVSHITSELRDFCIELCKTMREAKGIGISAPQVGVNKRIVVVDDGGRNWILINPEILSKDANLVTINEGCLSVPGVYEDIARPDKVMVRYRDINGKPDVTTVSGLKSRILQHEIDHLDGVIFTDYLTNEGSAITI